jgi:hypothetical protein
MGFHMRHGWKKLVGVQNLNYYFLFASLFSYCKKPSKSLNFQPLFPNLKAITEIYGQSQMSANFCYFYTVCSFFCFDVFKHLYFSAFCTV